METITDFSHWLSSVELEDHNDVYSLYQAVDRLEDWGAFSISKKESHNSTRYFVKCSFIDDVLLLASEKAKHAFLNQIEKKYAGEMTIEGWYGYMYAMSKDN